MKTDKPFEKVDIGISVHPFLVVILSAVTLALIQVTQSTFTIMTCVRLFRDGNEKTYNLIRSDVSYTESDPEFLPGKNGLTNQQIPAYVDFPAPVLSISLPAAAAAAAAARNHEPL